MFEIKVNSAPILTGTFQKISFAVKATEITAREILEYLLNHTKQEKFYSQHNPEFQNTKI